ncbi:MAG: hypothetical protein V7L06_23175 [Nostoc sp.]
MPFDLVALVYGWDKLGNETLEDEVIERLGFEDLDDFRDRITPVEGDKLGGYPEWVQKMSWLPHLSGTYASGFSTGF